MQRASYIPYEPPGWEQTPYLNGTVYPECLALDTLKSMSAKSRQIRNMRSIRELIAQTTFMTCFVAASFVTCFVIVNAFDGYKPTTIYFASTSITLFVVAILALFVYRSSRTKTETQYPNMRVRKTIVVGRNHAIAKTFNNMLSLDDPSVRTVELYNELTRVAHESARSHIRTDESERSTYNRILTNIANDLQQSMIDDQKVTHAREREWNMRMQQQLR